MQNEDWWGLRPPGRLTLQDQSDLRMLERVPSFTPFHMAIYGRWRIWQKMLQNAFGSSGT